MPRVLPQPQRCQTNGFALPIALGGSLLLLLSGGSLQLLALHTRVRLADQQRLLQLEDLLASAAQQQAAALTTKGHCLLAVGLVQWAAAGASCGMTADQVAALQQGQVGEQSFRVVAYRPAAEGGAASAELELQLTGARPWRASFRLGLAPSVAAPEHLQVTTVQELGLRGARS